MSEKLREIFDRHEDEFLKFERVPGKLSNRADLHAFLLLDKLVPGEGISEDMVSSAEHDEIYLGIDCEKLEQAAQEIDIINLIRCGVRYDVGFESLTMFV